MNIGRAAISVFLICLLAFSMLAIFSIIQQNQATDAFYTNSQYDAINRSVNLTTTVLGTGSMVMNPLMLIVAILFILAAFFIFKRR